MTAHMSAHMSAQEIFLLDVDSVLVRPLGYRAALRATVDHFRARMGLRSDPPNDAEIDEFEAHGFGSEWHSVPVCVAGTLAQAAEARPDLWRGTLDETLAAVAEAAPDLPRPDYAALVHAIGADAVWSDMLAPRRALAYFAARTPPHARPVLDALLARTYDVASPATRVFQHHTLGSARFPATYGIAPEFETESLLMAMDEPLLAPEARALLRAARLPYAVYTARPSLPPAGEDATGFAPEAEMACALVGLADAPVIGYGHVAWLAQQHGAHPDAYVKPSPVQALAAVAAALVNAASPVALHAALAVADAGALPEPFAALQSGAETVRISVFEDTPAGRRRSRRPGRRCAGPASR
ncbi:MAG: hypothetical protein M5R40_23615 [Anaerolineae bacterium]|nr:hypothetical protein [Anaerolineae bacterium]